MRSTVIGIVVNVLLDIIKGVAGVLGWEPKANTTITDDIENGSYRNYKEQK